MLEGVTPFPPEFAARYRARGYWQDRPLYDGFRDCLRTNADRVAIIDDSGPVTYGQLEQRSARLARALLGLLREWDELGYDQSVMDLVFHANAERVLGL
jgi:2,3-dihydroxybenzoate---[aryl-carrier protein] ligase